MHSSSGAIARQALDEIELSAYGFSGLSGSRGYVTLVFDVRNVDVNVLLPERRVRPMSAAEAQEVKNLLLRSNDNYRKLSDRHHELDDRLHQLTELPYLTASEQVEEVTLKKRKLALKDQMEQMALEYAKSHFRAS